MGSHLLAKGLLNSRLFVNRKIIQNIDSDSSPKSSERGPQESAAPVEVADIDAHIEEKGPAQPTEETKEEEIKDRYYR